MGFPHLHAGMPCPPGAVPVRALNRWHAATRPMFVCDGVAQRRINRNARPISPRTPRRAQPYGIASRPTAHKTSLNAKATHLRSGRSACRDGGASSKFPIAHWGDRHIATLPQRLPRSRGWESAAVCAPRFKMAIGEEIPLPGSPAKRSRLAQFVVLPRWAGECRQVQNNWVAVKCRHARTRSPTPNASKIIRTDPQKAPDWTFSAGRRIR